MKLNALTYESLHDSNTDVLERLTPLQNLDILVEADYFITLIDHPQVKDLWVNYVSKKYYEEHPYNKDIIKGKFRFLSINWEVTDE